MNSPFFYGIIIDDKGMVMLLKNKLKRIFKSEKYKKMKLLCLIGISIILLFAGGFLLTSSIIQLFSNPAEEIKYIEENGMKYISIKDGFIAEELKVQAGALLPNLKEYFNESYELDSNATVTYYDGEDSLDVADFTYVKDDNTYVRGIKNLTAKITNNNENYESKLVIEDTETPTVLLQDVTITEGEAVDATKFVAIFVDNSQIVDFNATIVGTDEYAKIGSYELKINVCDMANNCVINNANLTIKEKEEVLEEDISSFETSVDEEESPETPEPTPPPQTPTVVPAPKLTKLTISKGTLSPTFKSSVTSYKATVANSVSSIKITATAASGSTFISGYGSRTVNLKVGSNTIYVKVKNKDNKTVAYKMVITRKAASSSGGGTGSGGTGSGGTGSGDSGSGGSTTTPEKERVFIEKRTSSNFPFRMINHYGAKEYYLASSVTYNLYTDNYVEVLSFDGSVWTEWDFSGYKTDVKAMKKEAEEVLAANASTREYFLKKTNETRAANGVAPVTLDYDLSIVATMRTFELTYGNTLSHTRPDGQRFYTILKEYGFKAGYLNGTKHYGENMAYWQNTDASAYTALISSSGHKQNILDTRWKKMGVGTFTFYGRRYWIQLFTT